MTLPVLVMRRRFLAPLWVFNFGILLLSDGEAELAAGKFRRLLDDYGFAKHVIDNALGHLKAQFAVS